MTETIGTASGIGAAPATSPLGIFGRKAVLPPIAGGLPTNDTSPSKRGEETGETGTSGTTATSLPDTSGPPDNVVRRSSDVRRCDSRTAEYRQVTDLGNGGRGRRACSCRTMDYDNQ